MINGRLAHSSVHPEDVGSVAQDCILQGGGWIGRFEVTAAQPIANRRYGPARLRRNQRSADSLVRVFEATTEKRADKAVRAPQQSSRLATILGDTNRVQLCATSPRTASHRAGFCFGLRLGRFMVEWDQSRLLVFGCRLVFLQTLQISAEVAELLQGQPELEAFGHERKLALFLQLDIRLAD